MAKKNGVEPLPYPNFDYCLRLLFNVDDELRVMKDTPFLVMSDDWVDAPVLTEENVEDTVELAGLNLYNLALSYDYAEHDGEEYYDQFFSYGEIFTAIDLVRELLPFKYINGVHKGNFIVADFASDEYPQIIWLILPADAPNGQRFENFGSFNEAVLSQYTGLSEWYLNADYEHRIGPDYMPEVLQSPFRVLQGEN